MEREKEKEGGRLFSPSLLPFQQASSKKTEGRKGEEIEKAKKDKAAEGKGLNKKEASSSYTRRCTVQIWPILR